MKSTSQPSADSLPSMYSFLFRHHKHNGIINSLNFPFNFIKCKTKKKRKLFLGCVVMRRWNKSGNSDPNIELPKDLNPESGRWVEERIKTHLSLSLYWHIHQCLLWSCWPSLTESPAVFSGSNEELFCCTAEVRSNLTFNIVG